MSDFEGTEMQRDRRPYTGWLWVAVVILSLIKLWLVRSQTLYANCDNRYDERLFLNLAAYLLDGQWLGPYDQFTLAKGMFYPLWIAGVHALGVPLLISQHLLYIAASFATAVAFRPVLRSRTSFLVLFGILLMNPMSNSDGVMTAVLREGIYPSLTLLTVACAAGFLVRYDQPVRKIIVWPAGLGAALSAMWLTREEGMWIIPFIFFMLLSTAVAMRRIGRTGFRRLLLCAVPILVWLVSLGTVAGINLIRYDIFTTAELKSADFLSAYGALLRVKHSPRRPVAPIPEEVRTRIYKVSPAFAELKPFLEPDLSKRWGGLLKQIRERFKTDPVLEARVRAMLRLDLDSDRDDVWVRMWNTGELFSGETPGAFFVWAFRDAVAAAGYYESGLTAARYYGRLANEVNSACADGKLVCLGERASMMPPWYGGYTDSFMRTFFDGLLFFVRFENFFARSSPSEGSSESLAFCQQMTGEQFLRDHSADSARVWGWRTRALEKIGRIYQFMCPVLSLFGFIAFVLSLYWLIGKRKNWTFFIINTGLIVAMGSRLFLISLIHLSSFPAISTRYLSPVYPILLLFIVSAVISLMTAIKGEHHYKRS